MQGGVLYDEGESIETADPCEHCYCMQGKTVCAVESCMGEMEGQADHCVPTVPPPGQCCPTEYKCGEFCFKKSQDGWLLFHLQAFFLKYDNFMP